MRRAAVRVKNASSSFSSLLSTSQLAYPRPRSHLPTSKLTHTSIQAFTRLAGLSSGRINAFREIALQRQQTSNAKIYLAGMSLAALVTFVLDDFRVLALSKAADNYVDGTMMAFGGMFLWALCARVRRDMTLCWSMLSILELVAIAGILADVQMISSSLLSECETRHYPHLKLIAKAARLARFAIKFIGLLTSNQVTSLAKIEPSKTEEHPQTSELRFRKASSVVPFNESDVRGSNAPEPAADEGGLRENHRQRTTAHAANNKLKKVGTFKKLYKESSSGMGQTMSFQGINTLYESRISKNMTRRLVVLMTLIGMALCLCSWVTIPAFSLMNARTSHEYGLDLLSAAWDMPRFANMTMEYISAHRGQGGLDQLVQLTIKDTNVFLLSEELRDSELCTYSHGDFSAIFSIAKKVRILAVFDLCMSVFFCVLTMFVCIQLSRDISDMIIYPLERMIETVRLMARNPLKFVKLTPISTYDQSQHPKSCCRRSNNIAQTEIKLLENAFRKIGIMLAIVYGTAGSEMISSTLQFEVDFSPLVPGREILAVFCFAKIANFDASLVSMKARIFSYVNLISKLAHYTCEKHFGSVNRNLGDAFLLVWKFPNDEGIVVKSKHVINSYSPAVKSEASLALLFAVKTIIKASRSQQLFRLLHKRGFAEQSRTNLLSFGFHAGWAYEGPIGSHYKIDASYLSPNVNTASRIESATKLYSVPILLSQDMYFLLEDEVQSMVRHIDTVQLKGTAESTAIFSFDISETTFELTSKLPKTEYLEQKRRRLRDGLDRGLITVSEMFTKSETVASMRKGINGQFLESYAEGLKLYLAGDWNQAKDVMEDCLCLVKKDRPTKTVLKYMKRGGFVAPAGWRGVRELESK